MNDDGDCRPASGGVARRSPFNRKRDKRADGSNWRDPRAASPCRRRCGGLRLGYRHLGDAGCPLWWVLGRRRGHPLGPSVSCRSRGAWRRNWTLDLEPLLHTGSLHTWQRRRAVDVRSSNRRLSHINHMGPTNDLRLVGSAPGLLRLERSMRRPLRSLARRHHLRLVDGSLFSDLRNGGNPLPRFGRHNGIVPGR